MTCTRQRRNRVRSGAAVEATWLVDALARLRDPVPGQHVPVGEDHVGARRRSTTFAPSVPAECWRSSEMLIPRAADPRGQGADPLAAARLGVPHQSWGRYVASSTSVFNPRIESGTSGISARFEVGRRELLLHVDTKGAARLEDLAAPFREVRSPPRRRSPGGQGKSRTASRRAARWVFVGVAVPPRT